MEGTCKKKDCYLWKKHEEKCPNFIRSYWKSTETNVEKPVEDCAPIRTLLMLQELYNKFIGVQQATEETRNALVKIGEIAKTRLLE